MNELRSERLRAHALTIANGARVQWLILALSSFELFVTLLQKVLA